MPGTVCCLCLAHVCWHRLFFCPGGHNPLCKGRKANNSSPVSNIQNSGNGPTNGLEFGKPKRKQLPSLKQQKVLAGPTLCSYPQKTRKTCWSEKGIYTKMLPHPSFATGKIFQKQWLFHCRDNVQVITRPYIFQVRHRSIAESQPSNQVNWQSPNRIFRIT